MSTRKISCPVCKNTHVIKFGLNRQGKQRYRCQSSACPRKTFLLTYEYKGHEVETQQKIVAMALNGSGVRETGRVLGISYNTVTAQLKKSPGVEHGESRLLESA